MDFLIPDVLSPIPGTLTQAIRNFAKSLETWLSGSLNGYSSNLVKAKVCVCVCGKAKNSDYIEFQFLSNCRH